MSPNTISLKNTALRLLELSSWLAGPLVLALVLSAS